MTCGLVLAGGGARGAYEMGVLAELLPKLDRKIDVVVGTSIGAVNATFLAARADDPTDAVIDAGVEAWSALELGDIIKSPLVPRLSRVSLLDPAPIERTLERLVPVDRIARNVPRHMTAAAVVATDNATGRSVVFHQGGSPKVVDDRRRDIHYVPTTLAYEHIRASAALPTLFPAVRITEPAEAAGWYFDGGTRLNTPIKPALALGADHVVIVGLSSTAPSERPKDPPEDQPDLFEGASHVLQGLFNDPLAADVRELADRNADPRRDDELIHYAFVTPQTRTAIGDLAADVFRKELGRLRDLFRDPGLAVLGRLLDGGEDAVHGELLSYLFFDPAFAEPLMEMGRADARRWLGDGLWRT